MKKSTKTVRQPLRLGRWGKLVQVVGFVLILLGLGQLFLGLGADIGGKIIGGFVMLGVGIYLFFTGMRLASIPADELLSRDLRPPIVFVRSFKDEQGDKSVSGFLRAMKTAFMQQGRYASAPMTSPWGPTFQWQLNKLLKEVGPYVAIGRPGEKLVGMGASRMYVSDDDWQDVIGKLFKQAGLIIMRMGKTPGLRWELKQLRHQMNPRKLLFILPHNKADYIAFRQWANKELPKPMPEKMPTSRFMILGDDWSPQELEWRDWLLDTLEPYFNRNGISRKNISLWYRVTNNSALVNVLLSMLLMVTSVLVAIWVFG